MKKWLRWISVVALVATLTGAVVFEASTHVARGWLHGEAFFDGRPTSYWRQRLDHWLTQFVNPEDAVRCMIIHNGADAVDGVVVLRPDRHPLWGPFRDFFRSEVARAREWDTPDVLMGNPDAVPVLQELARVEKYRLVAEHALK